MTRKPIARLPWLIRTHFETLQNSHDKSRNISYLIAKLCCLHSSDSPHRGDPNDYTQHTIFIEDLNDIPKLSPLAS